MLFSIITALMSASIGYTLYLVFLVAPDERVMGAVQRIFYFHVPSAFATYLILAFLFFGALGYLATSGSDALNKRFDALQQSAAEIALLFASIMLFTGMIWGNAAWGTPFAFEPRLVASLILWLMLVSLNLFRVLGDSPRLSTHLAALGIISCLTVPVVVYSIKLLPQFQQLHPQVVEKGGLPDPLMKQAFYIASLTVMGFSLVLLWLRFRMAEVEIQLKRAFQKSLSG